MQFQQGLQNKIFTWRYKPRATKMPRVVAPRSGCWEFPEREAQNSWRGQFRVVACALQWPTWRSVMPREPVNHSWSEEGQNADLSASHRQGSAVVMGSFTGGWLEGLW